MVEAIWSLPKKKRYIKIVYFKFFNYKNPIHKLYLSWRAEKKLLDKNISVLGVALPKKHLPPSLPVFHLQQKC